MFASLAAVGTPNPDVISTITTNSADLLPTLLAAGGIGVGVSLGVLALVKGFGFFRKLVKV